MRSYLLLVMTGALAVGCGGASGGRAALTFGEPVTITGTDSVGFVSVSLAGSATTRAAAWVATPAGSDAATLFVQVGAAPPVAVVDSAGPASTDPETPPKIRFAPDGSLDLLYGVAKKVAGEPWPFTSLRFRRSTDGGRTWSAPVLVSDDGDFGRYRNDHAFTIAADGTRYVAWLDQRGKNITLAFARSTDQGATWSRTIFVDTEGPCECCRSALATSADGRVFLAWRKKLPGGIRDIVVASSADQGETWSAPVRAHADDWEIDGCPDAGPSLLADADGTLHLAWWTGKPGAAGVRYARSPDGRQWQEPIPLGVGPASSPAHVQLARIGPDSLIAVWEDGTLQGKPVVMAFSATNGASFTPAAPLSAENAKAGFPVVTASGRDIAVAWSQDGTIPGRRSVVARVAVR